MKKIFIITVVSCFAAAGLVFAEQAPKFGNIDPITKKKGSKTEKSELHKKLMEEHAKNNAKNVEKMEASQPQEKKK